MSIYDTTPTLATEQAQASNTGALAATNTDTMSTSEANSILNNYGIDSSQVLSSTNVANTVSGTTPAADDLLGIRNQLNSELGLTDANTKLNAIKSQYYKAPSVIEGQRLNMSVLRGETGLAQERLLAEIQAQQDSVTSLTAERDYRMGLAESNVNFVKQLKLQYAGAKINYGDSMDTIEKKLVNYQKDQKKEAEKDALKATAMQIGISTKGLSKKELEKKLKKYYKSEKSYNEAVRSKQLESSDISLSLQKIQLAKANKELELTNKMSDPNYISSLFPSE